MMSDREALILMIALIGGAVMAPALMRGALDVVSWGL